MTEGTEAAERTITDSEAQLAVAQAIHAQALARIDLTIPAQRTVANEARQQLGLLPLSQLTGHKERTIGTRYHEIVGSI